MPPAFTAQSPLAQAVTALLREQPEGLFIPELRYALLRSGRPGVSERDLEQLVRLPDFLRLPGGKIVLRASQADPAATAEALASEQPPELPYDQYPSTLQALPSLSEFVIFDTETNGLNPQTADFFQLSAIKVVNGQAIATCNLYARVETAGLPRALRAKLHFDELHLEEKIQSAGSQAEALAEFLQFAGPLPLVAHNGTFDLAFLCKHLPNLPNPLVDSLEIMVLAYPAERSHSIEPLANMVGFVQGGAHWNDVLALDQALGISAGLGVSPSDLFHSAIFDCLILHLLLQHARSRLAGLGDPVKALVRQLAPALGDWISAPPAPSDPPADLGQLISLRPWGSQTQERSLPRPPITQTCTAPSVLAQYNALLEKAGWQRRNAQAEMLRLVAETIEHSQSTMLEAPTGTGKTLAYLIPALIQARSTGQQAVISTSTRALQDQLLRDLERLLCPYLPFEFHYAVLKGQNNYLCLTRLWHNFSEAFYGPASAAPAFEERLALLYLLRFAAESADGDLQNTSFWLQKRFPILGYLKNQVASERETCGAACEYHPYCFHPRARALADTADLLVVNHTLLMTRHWNEEKEYNLVLDEAHNLEEVATNALTEEASQALLENWLRRLLQFDGRRGALVLARRWLSDPVYINRAIGSVRAARRVSAQLGGYLREFLERQGTPFSLQYGATWRMRAAPRRALYFYWQHVQRVLDELLRALDDLREELAGLTAQLGGVPQAIRLLRELQAVQSGLFGTPEQPGLRTLLEGIPAVGYDPLVRVHWIELGLRGRVEGETVRPEQITWAFKRAPVRVADALEALVYQRSRSLVLTSATLTLAEGGFSFFLDRLGLGQRLGDAQLHQLPKEFDYARQVLLGMPGYLKFNAQYDQIKPFTEEMARELGCLFQFTEGRGLVLHTARSRMEQVAQYLEQALPNIPVFWQREGISTRSLKEDFEAREESVLLGVRSFWEGIDVPGPALSYLVIEKLPFPVPTDPIIASRCEQIRAAGGNEWMGFLIPLATLQFKQGFGRLMRKDTDRGVVIYMDKRLRTDAFYRESVLSALPGFKRSDTEIEAEENRLDFYRSIGRHMQAVFPWDWEARLDMFPCIREEILPDLERLLREYQLPRCLAPEDYPAYRSNLLRVASELIPGFQDFRSEQDQAMQSMLACNDTLVVLPTGAGKSLTFQLPALLRDGVTLVFSPLIALMRDQVDKLRGKGLTLVDYIVSGQSGAHRDDVYRRMRNGNLRLVYIAPERIRDPALSEALRHSQVVQVVVDEAHCVHMWGHSFRPDFLGIPSLFTGERPPIAALTATAAQETRAGIAAALELRQGFDLITKSVDRPELKFVVYNNRSAPERITSQRDKLRVLIKILRAAQRRDETAIVYTSTVREAEQVARLLDLHGFGVRYYHGRMLAQARTEVQEMFREGAIRIIVATKAFGMGIDKSDVRYIIHYDVPGDLESYYQEAGRAGRDGQTAYCVLLYHRKDLGTQQFFIDHAFPDNELLNSLLQALQAHQHGQAPMLVNPQTLADESGVELEQLNVALHLLERMGYFRRMLNFTLQASLLLNRSPQWLAQQLSAEQSGMFQELVDRFGLSHQRGIQLDLLEAGQVMGTSPLLIDQFFLELSARGWAVYRPWERGYVIEPLEKLGSAALTPANLADITPLKASMARNLRKMVRYAESLGKGECRRAFAVEHFGETLSQRPTPCCDLCDPNQALPWRDIPSEDVTDLPAEVDPAYLALRAVEWNQDRQRAGYSPYTARTLSLILAGNAYAAARSEPDPTKRIRRIRRLERSPFYAVLQGLRGGHKATQSLLQRLQTEGYTHLETIAFASSGAQAITYLAPFLTERGLAQLRSGKYIGDESNKLAQPQ